MLFNFVFVFFVNFHSERLMFLFLHLCVESNNCDVNMFGFVELVKMKNGYKKNGKKRRNMGSLTLLCWFS